MSPVLHLAEDTPQEGRSGSFSAKVLPCESDFLGEALDISQVVSKPW